MASAIHFGYRAAKVHWVDTPGSRIRALRKAKGLTQPQLAEAVGIDQSTISDIERGAGINGAVLMRLCDELEAPADFIMRGRSAAWPMRKVALERFLALSPEDRAYAEGKLESAIEHCEAGLSAIPNGGYAETRNQIKQLPDSHADTVSSTDEVKRRLLQRDSEAGAGNEAGRAVRRVPGKRGNRRA